MALALELPWEKWTDFLHPSQRSLVERTYAASARVAGLLARGRPSSRSIALCAWLARAVLPAFCGFR